MFILFLLLASPLFTARAFGQGRSQKMRPAPLGEYDEDQPQKRAEWNMRGREAPKGESAAALRLRAHQQKMAMRAQREAAARAAGAGVAPAAPTPWVSLGPAPLESNATGKGIQNSNCSSVRATYALIDP